MALQVCVCGPYSGRDVISTLGNMRRGIALTIELVRTNKFAVYSPWLDFQWGLVEALEMEIYKANSMRFVENSDAILLVSGWENSLGSLS